MGNVSDLVMTSFLEINNLYNATGQKVSKIVTQTGVTTTTDYLSGFQYMKKTASEPVVLQFFPHAEGYVNATQNGTSYTFNYVYNYTDHLGNIRLSYSQDPSTNVLKVIEENHYYPFGLKHTGYNSDQLMYVKEASVLKIKPVPPLFKTSYDVKYQGQKRQEELGLNWDSFKWRNYDYAIGRFMSIDPLAEKYAYNSTYAFQENKMGLGKELEGLELLPFHLYNYGLGSYYNFKSKISGAQKSLNTSINNRVSVAITRKEKNNVEVKGMNVNKVSDYSTMAKSIKTISNEAKVATKQVARDGADALETTGDVLVVASPATGPAAPVVAGIGGTMSTIGTTTNIGLDVVEGDFKSAGKRFVNEVITGGLSTIAKKAPGVDKKTSQLIDAHIEVYDNVVVPVVQDKVEEKKNN